MIDAWSFGGGPPASDSGAETTLIEGSSFCISDPQGDIRPGTTQGLFFRDTRILSGWRLRLDGVLLHGLAVQHDEPFSATFVCRSVPAPGHADSTLLVRRSRHLGDGMREDLVVENLSAQPVTCSVVLDVEADFADVFEVKENRAHVEPSQLAGSVGAHGLDLAREWHGRTRGIRVAGHPAPRYGDGSMLFHLDLPARGTWSACLQVIPRLDAAVVEPRHPCGQPVAQSVPIERLSEWRQETPAVSGTHHGLLGTLRRSREDLGVLRIFDPEHPDREVVAAGAPWFMTLFGRDSLLTAWMALPLSRRLALGTLLTLARYQGVKDDPVSEEQPGRILHEVRFGLSSAFALGGSTAYYGTADATPLFVMLVGELSRWGASLEELEPLLPHVDRALEWIDAYGDRDGDGFVEYEQLSPSGLANQGWKDSWDGVTDAGGRPAVTPIALCEVQGYVYAAMVARSELAGRQEDLALAAHWADRAARLRRALDDAFWLPDRGYYALALDGRKRPVDSLASNMGHLLWTGAVEPARAAAVAAHLVSPEMFSGWGIRTLATSMPAYNAMSYHNGSVWPHDNAIVAAGLMRYGFVEEATRVAEAMLEAAEASGGRLPELFCGFDREPGRPPIPYPTACSPQAWAAAAPLLLLRTLLRLQPSVPDGVVHLAPALPHALLPLRIEGVAVGDGMLAIDVTSRRTSVSGLPPGLRLVRRPPAP